MDIYCTRCGEPWDTDVLHEIADEYGITYSQARTKFRLMGCGAVPYASQCEPVDNEITEASRVMFDVLGDDVDGIAAMMEDMFG